MRAAAITALRERLDDPETPTTLRHGLGDPRPVVVQAGLRSIAHCAPAFRNELRALAARQFKGQRLDHTLQATALVHEAWIRLADKDPDEYSDRSHFLATAARAMRHVLVDDEKALVYKAIQLMYIEFSDEQYLHRKEKMAPYDVRQNTLKLIEILNS